MIDERVDHGLLPGIAQVRSQFEDTTAALYTTAMRCPIGIAHSVEDQACSPGITAILSAGESVRRTLGPGSVRVRCQLPNYAAICLASERRNAIKIASRVANGTALGSPPVRTPSKAVEDTFRPSSVRVRGQLKDHALSVNAAVVGCAVEVAGWIENQANTRIVAIRVVERMERALRPAPSEFGTSLKTVPGPVLEPDQSAVVP